MGTSVACRPFLQNKLRPPSQVSFKVCYLKSANLFATIWQDDMLG
jgi:hypothetical protein